MDILGLEETVAGEGERLLPPLQPWPGSLEPLLRLERCSDPLERASNDCSSTVKEVHLKTSRLSASGGAGVAPAVLGFLEGSKWEGIPEVGPGMKGLVYRPPGGGDRGQPAQSRPWRSGGSAAPQPDCGPAEGSRAGGGAGETPAVGLPGGVLRRTEAAEPGGVTMLLLPLRTNRAPRWASGPRHRCNPAGPQKPGAPAATPRPGRRAGSGALDEAVAATLSSRPFYEARQERFVRGVAAWLPDGAAGLAPSTVAKLAQYLARHRLREPRLLDAIAAFLLRRAPHLEAKVLQQLVFPFSRLNYRPPNEAQLFPRLEAALARRPPSLATVNVLISLAQLRRFPQPLLRKVFAPAFQHSAAGSPCGWIMRRYLSLLDAAVALEVPGYEGPRLDPQLRVRMFEGALTADEANSKYSFKGLVAEALRQLLGEECFRQDAVLPPGYCVDFLLRIFPSGEELPHNRPSSLTCTRLASAETSSTEMQDCSPPPVELLDSARLQGGKSPPPIPQDCHCGQSKKPFPLNSSAQTSPPLDLSSTPSHATCFHRFTDSAQGTGQLPLACPRLSNTEGATRQGPRSAAEDACRVVLSVNDQWHYCQNSDVLVGSRAMRNRHLHLLGYHLIQLPYTELQQVRGIEEAKHYLHKRLEGLWS